MQLIADFLKGAKRRTDQPGEFGSWACRRPSPSELAARCRCGTGRLRSRAGVSAAVISDLSLKILLSRGLL